MPRHKILSIKEQGGLKVYLAKEGIDYNYYKELRASLGDKQPGAIAKLLSNRAQLSRPLTPGRVKNWFKVDDQEEIERASTTH